MSDLWQEVWDETVQEELNNERSRGYTPDQFYVSGRKSKAYPNKETPEWWAEHGPKFVASWVNWRNHSGLDIWTTPDGEPAIELPVVAERPQPYGKLLSVIDRVMVDSEGELYILDLKSGSQTPAWPRQIALNNLGLFEQYGVRARWGGFWSSRKGSVDLKDLRIYSDEWMWEQIRMARAIRDQQLFVAQPTMMCASSCSVKDFCLAMGGPLSITIPQPGIFLESMQP